MNRLSPLIVRRVGGSAPPLPLDWSFGTEAQQSALLDDIKLFATGWLGGVVFFGTFLA
ncbi:MAG TPA: hypothetical protein VGD19_03275 [Allosphingosinicella sp.]|jgi:hypothetical protein